MTEVSKISKYFRPDARVRAALRGTGNGPRARGTDRPASKPCANRDEHNPLFECPVCGRLGGGR